MVPQTQQNKTCSKTDLLSVRQLVSNMPYEFWLFCIVDAMGYSAVHAFYPNMPKFFQEKFSFTNTEAGTVSSVPYLIASLTVPLLGTILRSYPDFVYEQGILCSLFLIFMTHLSYILI